MEVVPAVLRADLPSRESWRDSQAVTQPNAFAARRVAFAATLRHRDSEGRLAVARVRLGKPKAQFGGAALYDIAPDPS